MKNWLIVLCTLVGLQSLSAHANSFDHSKWNTLLNEHVVLIDGGKASQADYQGFADDSAKLQDYLSSLEKVKQSDFDTWPKNDQLAFLANAYNAWTVDLILTKWPDLKSIKDLGSLFSSPWSKEFIPLLGKTRSLDDIEHKLIRGSDRYNDPRIHFGVNCASIGCPALGNQAFTGDTIDSMLDTLTENFLSDSSRNYIKGDSLVLSPIFKWYGEDFKKGWKGYNSLNAFISHYASSMSLTAAQKAKLDSGKLDIEFSDYDWNLNKK